MIQIAFSFWFRMLIVLGWVLEDRLERQREHLEEGRQVEKSQAYIQKLLGKIGG